MPTNKPCNSSLSYLKNTDHIGRLLSRHKIKISYNSTQQIKNLRGVKAPQTLTETGVYLIPCSCRTVYIDTTKESTKTRIFEP